MKTIRVQYTVKESFAEQNKKNIQAVMNELRALDGADVKYSAHVMNDGKTFMHLVHYNSENAENLPSSLDSFKRFQQQLKENLEIPPKVETFESVHSSFSLF